MSLSHRDRPLLRPGAPSTTCWPREDPDAAAVDEAIYQDDLRVLRRHLT